jgi:hypothetical protein
MRRRLRSLDNCLPRPGFGQQVDAGFGARRNGSYRLGVWGQPSGYCSGDVPPSGGFFKTTKPARSRCRPKACHYAPLRNNAPRREDAPPHHPPPVPLVMAWITSSASAVLGRRSRSSAIKSARRAAVPVGSPKDVRKASASANDNLTAFGSDASRREMIQPTHASRVSIRICSLRPGSAASRGCSLLTVASSGPWRR